MDNIDTMGNNTANDTGAKGVSSGPGTNEVWIQDMAFNPATIISVAAGTTIKWTNKDAADHTVTSDSGLFDSGKIRKDGTYSYMFQTAGTYLYICAFHTSMTAKIVVY
jgi:plastocyanin